MAFAHTSISTTKAFLSISQEDIKNLCLKSVSLARKLDEASDVGLVAVSESFENALLQVEHFYSHLHISREKLQSDQIIKDVKVISFRDWPCLTPFFNAPTWFVDANVTPCTRDHDYENLKF